MFSIITYETCLNKYALKPNYLKLIHTDLYICTQFTTFTFCT